MDYFQDALQTFNGGNWYGWKTHDDDGNKIPNSERMQYKYIKIIKDGAIMPTETEVNAKIQELKGTNSTSSNYAQQRKNAYPNIGDQLDMQYWDNINGTTNWEDAIDKVKADNPK